MRSSRIRRSFIEAEAEKRQDERLKNPETLPVLTRVQTRPRKKNAPEGALSYASA